MDELLGKLRQRKLVQWAVAYAAGAWVLLQVLSLIAATYDWPPLAMRVAVAAVAIGFCVALVLAWYHGERGAQRVSGTELLILTLLLAVGGGILWRVASSLRVETASESFPGSRTHAGSSARRPESDSDPIPIPAQSIAVLPFVNMSGDARNDYFSDGITEEILNSLTQIRGLKVAARTSAFAFKGKSEDLRRVGEVLGVANVLEGSVQSTGDEVRITAQLIDARNGFHRWSDKYDRKVTSIFAVEDEISRAIAEQLQLQLGDGSQNPAAAIDSRAHDAYLRGLALLRERNLLEAAKTFEQAVAIAPDFAQAWGALAEAAVLLPSYGLDTMDAAIPRAENAALRALSIEPNASSAQVALGEIHVIRGQWPQADQAFRKALAAAPGDAETIVQHAQFLWAAGQLELALAEVERAQRLDPLSGVIGSIRAQILMALHRFDAASAQIEDTLAEHADLAPAHVVAAMLAVDRGRYAEAKAHFRTVGRLYGNDPDTVPSLVPGYADPAQRAAALNTLATAPYFASTRRDAVMHAVALTRLGEHDRALAELESYAVHRNSTLAAAIWDVGLDPLREYPRFKAVLKKMALPYTPPAGARP